MSDDIRFMDPLDANRAHPALYWGSSKHPYTSLVAFVAGHEMAAMGARQMGTELPLLVPEKFTDFVAVRLRHDPDDPGASWQRLIADRTKTERAAFELFFELVAEYKKFSTS